MNKFCFFKITLLFSLLSFSSCAQDEDTITRNSKPKKFNIGVYVGTYYANRYTANIYDGYGYDWEGNKNNFANSFINRKINFEYGGGNGGPDRIAQALNVNHGDWFFDESDMPLPNSLKYNIAFLVGLQGRYCVNKKNSLLLSVNGAKLSVNGNFQITLAPVSAQTGMPGAINYRTFSIVGGEQRMIFQMGYQRIVSDDDKLNFFLEGGPIVTLVKYEKNQILINSLLIPLTTYYDRYGYIIYNARNLTGASLGAFAGMGMNITINPKWTVQLVYDASYERIHIIKNQAFKLQHAFGLRAYYNF